MRIFVTALIAIAASFLLAASALEGKDERPF